MLVKAARWDAVRTLLATEPLAGVKATLKQAGALLDADSAAALAGLREDFVTSLRLLDTSVYNNVFVDESRVALGVKVDFATPLEYLRDALEALDGILDLF